MKKNFFKKLSFVMAAAMVVTTLAPAGSASAASTPAIDGNSKTLLLGVDARDDYNFNIKNGVKGSTYKWTSNNTKVATVNAKNGVTAAKAVGTATITVAIKLPTGKTIKDTVGVTVKENIKTLTITNAPTAAIAVGEVNDFNRSYTTVTGGKTTDITRWEVTKGAETATIKDDGKFVATATGEYTIVARSFQSTVKYASWLKSKDATLVTATAKEVTVKVVNKIASFTAVKSNTVRVAFVAPITAAKTTDYVITDVKSSVKQYVKSATLSTDKKSVDVVLYSALTSGNTYALVATVDSTEMKAELAFVKGAVAKIEASNQIIPANAPSAIAYNVYDANGLDITADTTVYFESTIPFTSTLTLGNGVMANVTVVYTDYTTGKQIRSNQFTVTGSTSTASSIGGYSIAATGTTPNFTTPVVSIAKTDVGTKTLYTQVTDQYGVVKTATNGTDVSFVSLDPSVVIVDEYSGLITPVNLGTGYVKIVSGTLVKIVPITVKADAVATSISVVSSAVGSMTGLNGTTNNPTIYAGVLDQYGNKMAGQAVQLTLVNGTGVLSTGDFAAVDTTYLGLPISTSATSLSGRTLTPAKAGTAYIKVTSGTLAAQYISVSITSANNVETSYILDGVYDYNVEKGYNAFATGFAGSEVTLYTVNSSNEKVNPVTNGAVSASLVVTKPDGTSTTVATATATGTAITFDVKDATINNTTGTYTITAYKNSVAVASKTFVVSDTATAPVVTLTSNSITNGDASEATLIALMKAPTGYTVTSISYVSSSAGNADAVAALSNKAMSITAADTFGAGTLYNIKALVRNNATGRVYTVAISGAITVTK